MCLPEGERERERGMALAAVVFPQPQDPFLSYGIKDLSNYNYNYNLLGADGEPKWDFINQGDSSSICSFLDNNQTENYPYGSYWNNNCSPPPPPPMLPLPPPQNVSTNSNHSSEATSNNHNLDIGSTSTTPSSRPKRRRAKSRKNKEDIENQRMTHIAVERNRRKQMNEYLSVLRSLMPDSYVQRGDQASIIGGAINFVKELEQSLQFIGAEKEKEGKSSDTVANNAAKMPFSEFFTFPQYSTTTSDNNNNNNSTCSGAIGEQVGSEVLQSGIADIEVTMVESHANLKIRSKKRPKQLLKMVSSLHGMRLTILHLNVTTSGEIVLYSLSVKVEDDCKLGSVDEIAAAVYQMLDRIHQESILN